MKHTSPTEVPSQMELPEPTLEEIYLEHLPIVAARIWKTCCWAERSAGTWKVGDFRLLVISIAPEPDTSLYVQFWSEPEEEVVAEVCSGESSPEVVKYLQQPQRDRIRSLGFEIGGRARNFRKVISVHNVAEAEQIARETLRIFFECFDYRGQCPIEFNAKRGGRAEHMPVYVSLTPEDFAKLLADDGYTATVAGSDDGPLVLMQRGRRRFAARLSGRIAKNRLYRAVILDAFVDPGRPVSDSALAEANAALPGATVVRHDDSEIRVSALLRFDGGVTGAWIIKSVEAWYSAVRECERFLRKRRNPLGSLKPQEHVH
jgi:hypothetical protein